jgi:glycerol-3-phosphate dehydrogenase
VFSPHWRQQALSLADQGLDVIVLGAGITGCGIALDSVQRGLKTLLIERGDIASGTSSRSSKLIHGGLRYLKQMQFRITRLACRERDRQLTLNPHLVRPIRFFYPTYRGDRTPGWQVDFGLWMYDQLTGRPEKHTTLSIAELQTAAPGLTTSDLDRALAFNDAMADDARLTWAVAATAHAYGAGVLTRCDVVEAIRDPRGRVAGVVVEDLESGASHRFHGAVVINATGVWTDTVRLRLGFEGQHLRPSRGAHVILPPDFINLAGAVTVLSPDDGRPVFLIPHPEGILLGTTDHYYDGDLDDPRPTRAEVDYLIRAVTTAFPDRVPEPGQIRGAFAGLRPILDTYADVPSEASREEDVWQEAGALSVAGGKLTTWRSTAETAVDTALQLLPEERVRHVSRCHTKGAALAGLAPADLADQLIASSALEPQLASAMARRLGSLAWTAVQYADDSSELQPLLDDLDLCAAEVRAHLRWGAVLHLEDLVIRRTRVGMWQPARVADLLPRLRQAVLAETGWDGPRWERELERLEIALESWTVDGVE